jgi:hypothetical protein
MLAQLRGRRTTKQALGGTTIPRPLPRATAAPTRPVAPSVTPAPSPFVPGTPVWQTPFPPAFEPGMIPNSASKNPFLESLGFTPPPVWDPSMVRDVYRPGSFTPVQPQPEDLLISLGGLAPGSGAWERNRGRVPASPVASYAPHHTGFNSNASVQLPDFGTSASVPSAFAPAPIGPVLGGPPSRRMIR